MTISHFYSRMGKDHFFEQKYGFIHEKTGTLLHIVPNVELLTVPQNDQESADFLTIGFEDLLLFRIEELYCTEGGSVWNFPGVRSTQQILKDLYEKKENKELFRGNGSLNGSMDFSKIPVLTCRPGKISLSLLFPFRQNVFRSGQSRGSKLH